MNELITKIETLQSQVKDFENTEQYQYYKQTQDELDKSKKELFATMLSDNLSEYQSDKFIYKVITQKKRNLDLLDEEVLKSITEEKPSYVKMTAIKDNIINDDTKNL